MEKKIVTDGMSARKIMIEAMPMVKFEVFMMVISQKIQNNEWLHASVSTLVASALVKMHL